MLSEKMQAALNAQLNAEYFSSYLYLSMAAYFEAENLTGFANWMHMQADEERIHAMKFYHFINERSGRVTLQAIDQPATTWPSALAIFEESLRHEQKVTRLIHDLVDLAFSERDHATNSFLQWFVDEQVEEESSVDAIVQDLQRVGDSAQGLFLLDRELAQRAPAAEAGA